MVVPAAWAGLLLVAGLLARRANLFRLGGACESVGLVYSQSLIMLASLPMITAFSGPLADNALSAADRTLGFDWYWYAMSLRDHRWLLKSNEVAYMSFTWEPAAILVALFATERPGRAWRFVIAGGIALLITVAVFPLVPAVGAFVHFHITPAMYPNLHTRTPWSFAPAILAMKQGNKVIGSGLMVGYVSFPSYHAASAVIFTWAAWEFGPFRWLFLIVNICMAAAAMIVGGHYFVDLLGGAIVAVAAILVSAYLVVDDQPSPAVVVSNAT